MGQDKSLEAGDNLINPTDIPSQIPTNLEEADKYAIGSKLTREDMAKLWSTKDILGRDEREILVWYQSLNHFPFKSLIRLSKRGIISRKLSNIRTPPPPLCCLNICKVPQEEMEDQRQIIKQINQEALGDQTRGHGLN